MPDIYARIDETVIGPQLAVAGGGYELYTLADGLDINRTARSDLSQSSGVSGVEFYFYGDDPAFDAAIGIISPTAALTTVVGSNVGGIGWRLSTGQLVQNGVVIASGLPIPTKAELLSMVLSLQSAGSAALELYRGRSLIYTHALGAIATWHFAVSIASATAGDTRCIVNAGQWSLQTGALRSQGWTVPATVMPPVRISDVDLLTGPSDSPANVRYEGVIDSSGFDSLSQVSFWPWGERSGALASVGQVTVHDADGTLDALAAQDVRGQPVRVRTLQSGQPLSSALDNGRFVLERIEIINDATKRFVLRDSHDDLDLPLQRTPFLPFMTMADAWKPQPVLIGACLSVPAIPVSTDGALLWISDAPLGNVVRVFENGDDLDFNLDWKLDPGVQQLRLVSPPVGQVLVDASGHGGIGDAWVDTGYPFTGVDGGVINGMVAEHSGGATPVFKDVAWQGDTLGGNGKPSFTSGVTFPAMPGGGRSWIRSSNRRTSVTPGYAFRYQISVIGKLTVSLSPSLADAIVVANGTGYYEGTTANLSPNNNNIHLIAEGVGGVEPVATCLAARFLATQDGLILIPATLEAALREIFQRVGKANWRNTDAYAIDYATGYAGIGFYSRETVTARQALEAILPSYCASEFTGLDGLLRFTRLTNPSTATVDISLDQNDLAGEPTIMPDHAPALSNRMGYQFNNVVMSPADFVTDLVGVPPARRQELSRSHRGTVHSTVLLAARYEQALRAPPMPSLFYNRADAQHEIDRVCRLYTVNRDFYALSLKGDTRRVEPGQICRLSYGRYGLNTGKNLFVVSVKVNAITGNTDLRLWG